MRLVVGLGNPGERYRRTRHNMGFMVVDALGARLGTGSKREAHATLLSEVRLGEERVVVAKPLTFMNRSGLGVAPVLEELGGGPKDVLVVVDDVALELGVLRIREKGGHGGHNGLRSLIDNLGSDEFPRVRVGVGVKEIPEDLASFVLAEFSQEEVLIVQETVGRAAEAVECALKEGLDSAMNRFNGPPPP
jgi:PTH1 family peptidyl-tRNA hydrolase